MTLCSQVCLACGVLAGVCIGFWQLYVFMLVNTSLSAHACVYVSV